MPDQKYDRLEYSLGLFSSLSSTIIRLTGINPTEHIYSGVCLLGKTKFLTTLHYTPTNFHDNIDTCDVPYKYYIATVYPSLQDTIPETVNHSHMLLMMGKKLPETC